MPADVADGFLYLLRKHNADVPIADQGDAELRAFQEQVYKRLASQSFG